MLKPSILRQSCRLRHSVLLMRTCERRFMAMSNVGIAGRSTGEGNGMASESGAMNGIENGKNDDQGDNVEGSAHVDCEEDLLARIERLEAENKRLRDRVEFETIARTRAEVTIREQFVESSGGTGALQPIGKISSCFGSRFGTPRQGSLASLTRGTISLDPSVVGNGALSGLDEFSHVWIIFVFHENTNMHKFVSNKGKIFPSYVHPPQGGGKRVGLFATRTPHRPNPIGLSLAKVDRVDEKQGKIHLSSIDLIDGTPILDLKPFVPHVDFPNGEQGGVCIPKWVANPKFDKVEVEFEPDVKKKIEAICSEGKCKWYDSSESTELVKALEQIVALDPRGIIHGRGSYSEKNMKSEIKANGEGTDGRKSKPLKPRLFRDNFVLHFDVLRLAFKPHPQKRAIIVHAVEICDHSSLPEGAFKVGTNA